MCKYWQEQLAAMQQLIKDGARTPEELQHKPRPRIAEPPRKFAALQQHPFRPKYPVSSVRDVVEKWQDQRTISMELEELAVPLADGSLAYVQGALLDTGAYRGAIGHSRLLKVKSTAAATAVKFRPYRNSTLASGVGNTNPEVIGEAIIDWYLGGRLKTYTMLVLAAGDSLLIGNDFINARVDSIEREPDGVYKLKCDHISESGENETFYTSARAVEPDRYSLSNLSGMIEEHDKCRGYYLYAKKAKTMNKWSEGWLELVVPRELQNRDVLYVSKLDGTDLARHPFRVNSGFYKVKHGVLEVQVINTSFESAAHINTLEPVARGFFNLEVAPAREPGKAPLEPDMTEDELMDSLDIGPDVTAAQREILKKKLKNRLHYFSKTRIGNFHAHHHVIHTPELDADPSIEGQPRLFQKYRPLSGEALDACNATIDKLRDQGLLKPTLQGRYAAPVVMIKKPKGDGSGNVEYRMACDYRAINAYQMKDNYPLPDARQLLEAIGDADLLSAFDATSAFHQINLREGDEPKTTISTPQGYFCYTTMPFGLSTATATYQRLIDAVLSSVLWHPGKQDACAVGFVDDVLCYSKGGFEEHARVTDPA